MGLRQVTKQKSVKRGAEGKLKNRPLRQTERAKSIESEHQKTEDTTLSKDADWRRDDQGANECEDKSRIQ